ncbi:MAG: hypothetical protein A3F90_09610 [Deltaproteobacteria bacterium RIFCSPLOWO2_12_FULL_60_19]|nr:MAG: hypothetical protein A3F90_09610 [Deltaproteobacteria bacterium RIFCSPLOWO2_12_FULL_60_19]
MTQNRLIFGATAISFFLALGLPLMAQEKKAEKKKAEKATGDVGLLDAEKNYMILVTKEGKLITLDFDAKTKVTALEAKSVKVSDVGLGSAATVEYQVKEDKALEAKIKAAAEELARLQNEQKKVVTKMEYRAAKGE